MQIWISYQYSNFAFGKANSEIALFQSEVGDSIWEVSLLNCNKNGHHCLKLYCVLVDMGASRDPSFHQIKQFCYFRTCQVIVAAIEPFVPVEFAKKGWAQLLVLMRRLNTHPQELIWEHWVNLAMPLERHNFSPQSDSLCSFISVVKGTLKIDAFKTKQNKIAADIDLRLFPSPTPKISVNNTVSSCVY